MSEEQLKAAETEATAQVQEGVVEISEEDLEGVAGGITPCFPTTPNQYQPTVAATSNNITF